MRINKHRLRAVTGALCLASAPLWAQTDKATQLLQNGAYDQAKPLFQKLVKQSPSNANYNYGYGVCCLQTGDAAAALPYLQRSADRKVIEAFRYLGKAYYATYRFDDAVDSYEEYIDWLEKKKRDTALAESELQQARLAARMMKGVERVSVVDSVVVDKEAFLTAYKLSPEAGSLSPSAGAEGGVDYLNERGTKRIATVTVEGGRTALTSSIRLLNNWSQPELLTSIPEEGNAGYPFLMSDGVTLYYAYDGEGSMGGYDLFMTRYDSESGQFLRPDHVGMPFNSPANDYMMAIDESRQLGWFVSDRYQPEGKVCVYVFVPGDTKEVYDFDDTDEARLINVASLRSIRATWQDEAQAHDAQSRLAQARQAQDVKVARKRDFTFVVNDTHICYTLDDFHSAEAQRAYLDYARKQQDLSQLQQTLAEKRRQYAAGQTAVSASILDLETRAEDMAQELEALANQVRTKELNK
jgi:tetratricopeptide (TPR) repeat protein